MCIMCVRVTVCVCICVYACVCVCVCLCVHCTHGAHIVEYENGGYKLGVYRQCESIYLVYTEHSSQNFYL